MLSGGGGPGGGLRAPGVPVADLSFALGALGLSVYGGGGSDGRMLFDMAAVGCDAFSYTQWIFQYAHKTLLSSRVDMS